LNLEEVPDKILGKNTEKLDRNPLKKTISVLYPITCILWRSSLLFQIQKL
jgi:hypothetical protein